MWLGSLVLWALLGMSCGAVLAQEPVQRGPDNSSRSFVPGIDVLPTPGLPFSGVDRLTWARPLEGGGSVTRYGQAKVARDSQGRLYREAHHLSTEDADPAKTLYQFTIHDPVSHTTTSCDTATHLCHVTRFRAPRAAPIRPAGPFDGGRQFLARESLGTEQRDGLALVGTRETISIQPGAVGNEQPLTVQNQYWYSPDMQINLSVVRKDPRVGTQTVELVNFSRAEPDPSLFQVPSDYRIALPVLPVPAQPER